MSYDDIIALPHYVSKKRPQMSMHDRAAQFSPFAALVGFDDGIAEANRQTEDFVALDENYLQELDEKLQYVREHIFEQPLIEVTFFVPDVKKEGGSYQTLQGKLKKFDNDNKLLIFDDRQQILLQMIVSIKL